MVVLSFFFSLACCIVSTKTFMIKKASKIPKIAVKKGAIVAKISVAFSPTLAIVKPLAMFSIKNYTSKGFINALIIAHIIITEPSKARKSEPPAFVKNVFTASSKGVIFLSYIFDYRKNPVNNKAN